MSGIVLPVTDLRASAAPPSLRGEIGTPDTAKNHNFFERTVAPMIELTREPIDYAALTEDVRSPEAGAVVLFLGTVREMTDGRRTVALDYEAYTEMAAAKMDQLRQEACRRWPIVRAGIVHRLGRLELGEVSVAVAVSCPHRADAFEAGRFLIDRLKEIVPIWKQENWADGTTEWVHPQTDHRAD